MATFYEPPVTPARRRVYRAVRGDGYQDGYQEDFYDPAQQEAALWEDPDAAAATAALARLTAGAPGVVPGP